MALKGDIGRRQRRKTQTRAALLDAAMTLFRERGLYGTRIVDITEAADVGKGVFYNYFATKEALVAALVRDGVDLFEREFLMAVSPLGTLEERVEHLARAHEEFFERHPEYALLIHQGRGLLLLEEEANPELNDAFRDYLARLSRWLPPPTERSCWSPEVLLDAAATVAGAVAGYRSFRSAAALASVPSSIGAVLSRGVPGHLQRGRLA
jgi:AcrR family transcriptional regulator